MVRRICSMAYKLGMTQRSSHQTQGGPNRAYGGSHRWHDKLNDSQALNPHPPSPAGVSSGVGRSKGGESYCVRKQICPIKIRDSTLRALPRGHRLCSPAHPVSLAAQHVRKFARPLGGLL